MIKAESVTKMFGSKVAVNGITFEVKEGEVLGFLGPNGAGKSTTMRMLTGYIPMSAGSIKIAGFDIEDEPTKAKSKIGYLPENAPSYADSTVESFLSFIAEAKGLSGDAKHEAIDKAIATCQLGKVRHQSIDTLSKGYKHRTCFAQAILNDPPILILDEPTDGLDPNQKNEMRSLIREMGKNKAIIVSTHILEEVEAICTRVIIIDKGKIVFNGTPAGLRAKSPDSGTVVVRVKDVTIDEFSAAIKDIPEAGAVKEINLENGSTGFSIAPQDRKANLALIVKNLMDKRKWNYDELHTETGKLDKVFQNITSAETDSKTEAGK